MKPTVKIRNLIIGEGRPKICVPLAESNLEDLLQAASALPEAPCDLAEWRADYFDGLEDPGALSRTLHSLRECLGELPLLFTVRTQAEGGEIQLDTERYVRLCRTAAESGAVDLIDVELSKGKDAFLSVADAARKTGSAVIGSCHDFDRTPPKEAIVSALCQMQEFGCDIAKFAVTPHSARDVLTLLDATVTMQEEHGRTPIVTMAMGRMGVVSRISGGVFGSAITFGTIGKSSALGQLPAELLHLFLTQLA